MDDGQYTLTMSTKRILPACLPHCKTPPPPSADSDEWKVFEVYLHPYQQQITTTRRLKTKWVEQSKSKVSFVPSVLPRTRDTETLFSSSQCTRYTCIESGHFILCCNERNATGENASSIHFSGDHRSWYTVHDPIVHVIYYKRRQITMVQLFIMLCVGDSEIRKHKEYEKVFSLGDVDRWID